ncbi:hypothetical protein MSLAZ_3216 [Methanosarcina lacustris Z-7289]|uniref:DUF5320 domain-containing protein n=1 Tax=Methanosarcina lacustris Z-7289 TaxID=1434111 RepID=A0A0E3SA12_9EURY|nr:DUF5320 domain-containing protein [Methanosarcina lacustris]AKB76477.1 hypothetical protein MSLAZ_3216 [Methanosarcina lacustris Z-7289]
MPYGDRTGPMGQGSKTGWGMGYCSSSDSPGYIIGGPAGAGRGAGGGAGRGMGRGAGRGACRGFRCKRTPGFGRGGRFAARDTYPGYYYPAPSQSQTGFEADSLENRIKLLKQELETLDGKLKSLRLQESSVEK